MRHEQNAARKEPTAAEPAAVVSIRKGDVREAPPPVYSRKHYAQGTAAAAQPAAPGAPLVVGDRSQVQITGSGGSAGTLVVGDGSHVHINGRGGSGSGTLVVGDDSHVHINGRGGSGSGTLVVGDDSHVHINSRGGSGSGTLVVGDGSHVHINSRENSDSGTTVVGGGSDVHIDSGGRVAGSLIVGDGAVVHVNSREKGRFFIEEGSSLYVGCDFDSRRLVGGVEAPVRGAAHAKAAHLHGNRHHKDLNSEPRPSLDETSKREQPEFADPRLEIARALLADIERQRPTKIHEERGTLRGLAKKSKPDESATLD